MLLCVILASPLMKKRGENPDFLLDLMICVIPCSIIFARLWYVLFAISDFHSFKDVINIRSGGMAIYGGVLGGALGIFIACKIHKVNMGKILDVGAVMLPLGQAIGRWGNFFNQEVYGQEITNKAFQFFPLAVQIDKTGLFVWHQALFFYESILNIILFIGLYKFLWRYKGKTNGFCVALYFIGYGTIRGILENFRDSEYNLPFFGHELKIKAMVLISIILMVFGLLLLIFLKIKDYKIKKTEAENKMKRELEEEREKLSAMKTELEADKAEFTAQKAEKENEAKEYKVDEKLLKSDKAFNRLRFNKILLFGLFAILAGALTAFILSITGVIRVNAFRMLFLVMTAGLAVVLLIAGIIAKDGYEIVLGSIFTLIALPLILAGIIQWYFIIIIDLFAAVILVMLLFAIKIKGLTTVRTDEEKNYKPYMEKFKEEKEAEAEKEAEEKTPEIKSFKD